MTSAAYKRAAPRPIVGADKVARFLVGGTARNAAILTGVLTMVDGSPALALHLGGEFDGVMAIRPEDARIAGIHHVRTRGSRPTSRRRPHRPCGEVGADRPRGRPDGQLSVELADPEPPSAALRPVPACSATTAPHRS
ncbi:hypothetical protein ACGFSI_25100 [Streptomyces virginiae]|uniref:hypothetical protein n=1 Tax=Streptomyces virginiae TaxID=1961 RepID=UPI0037192B96